MNHNFDYVDTTYSITVTPAVELDIDSALYYAVVTTVTGFVDSPHVEVFYSTERLPEDEARALAKAFAEERIEAFQRSVREVTESLSMRQSHITMIN